MKKPGSFFFGVMLLGATAIGFLNLLYSSPGVKLFVQLIVFFATLVVGAYHLYAAVLADLRELLAPTPSKESETPSTAATEN